MKKKEETKRPPGDKYPPSDRGYAGGTGTGTVPECRQEISSKAENQEIGFW